MFTQTVCELKQFKRKSLFFYASLCLWACVGLMSSCASLGSKMLSKSTTILQDKGNIVITSTPEGANVIMDDKIIGKTPMTLPISAEFSLENKSDLPNNANKTISIVKNGYLDQTFIAAPSNTIESEGRSRNVTIFWLGLAQTAAGVVLSSSSKSTTSEPDAQKSIGEVLLYSGFMDLLSSCIPKERPKIITRSYEKNIHANLVSLEDDARQKREYAEKGAQEAERKRLADLEWAAGAPARAKALAEKERIAKLEWEAGAPARAELARKEQAAKEQFAKLIEAARILEQAEKEEALQKRRLEFAQLKEGDRICAKEANCGNSDDCLKVSAFVEKWNSDRTKYQIRIHTVNSGGTTYSDASGVYSEVDGIRYHKGEIIWINPFERPNTIWVSCHLK